MSHPRRLASLFLLLAGMALALVGASAAFAATESGPSGATKASEQTELRQQEIELRNAVRANPGDPANHVKLAQLYLKLGNYAAVEAEAREARQDGGDEDDTAPLLAEALLYQGKLTALLDQIRPADRAPESESTVRFALGMGHFGLGEMDQAEPLLNDAVKLDPDAWLPKLGLARLLLAQHHIDEAAAEIDAARKIAPDEIDVLQMDGQLRRVKGDNAGAVADFDKVLARAPRDVSALVSRGNALLGEGKLDDAARDAQAALKLDPKSPSAVSLSAIVLARQGKFKEADEELTSISQTFDDLVDGYYLAGAIKYALGQYELADADLAKFLAHRPNQPAAARIRALIALRRNSPRDAIELLKPVVDANPADDASVRILTRAYIAVGRYDDALALNEHAAETNPGNVQSATVSALMQMKIGDVTAGTAELERIAGTKTGADLAAPYLVLSELRRGDIAAAQQAVDGIAAKNPNDPVVLNLKGQVAFAAQRLDEAQQIFAALVTSHPDFLAARRNLADVLLAQNKPDDAKAVLLALIEKKPGDESALMKLADIAVQSNNIDEASARLKAAQLATPKDPTPGIRLVQIYIERKDWAKAGDAMRSLQSAFPADLRIIGLAGDLRADQGDLPGAEAAYQDLITRDPKNVLLYLRYAGLQNRAGDKDGARASLVKALALAPKDRQLMTNLVSFDYQVKGPDAALATARSFAATDPEEAAILAAGVFVQQKRNADALAALEAAQKLHPTGALAARIGGLQYVSGKTDEGRATLNAWIKAHADDVTARLALADADMRERKDADALTLYQTVQKLAPNDPVALNNLAILYARVKDPRAEATAEEAYRRAPSPQTGDTVGWVLVSMGKPDQGLTYLRDAGAADANDGTIQYHLAVAYSRLGQNDEARKILEQVIKTGHPFEEKPAAEQLLATLQHG